MEETEEIKKIREIILNYLKSKKEYRKNELLDKTLTELIKKAFGEDSQKIENGFKYILLETCYDNNILIGEIQEQGSSRSAIFKGNLLNLIACLMTSYAFRKNSNIYEIFIDISEIKKLFDIFEISEEDEKKILSYSTLETDERTYKIVIEDLYGTNTTAFILIVCRKIMLDYNHSQYQVMIGTKKLNEKFYQNMEDTKNKIDKSEMGIITVMGIFVSLFTLISTNVSFFKEAVDGKSSLEIVGLFGLMNSFTLFSVGALIFLVKYFLKDESKLSLKKLTPWILFVVVLGAIAWKSHSFIADQRTNTNTKINEIKIEGKAVKFNYEKNL